MKRRILLVEDNEHNRYLITYLLEHRGHEVVHAADGPQGVRLAGQARPDLILLDIQLPGMDGYAVARALKGDPTTASIPVVAVTSYAMCGDQERIMAAGGCGYIEKPIDPETFASTVESFIPEPGGRDAP